MGAVVHTTPWGERLNAVPVQGVLTKNMLAYGQRMETITPES
jgi:hypothetical protein